MNHPEEQDPVWDLLKQARPNQVDPGFAQEVLRGVRQLDADTARGRGRDERVIFLRFGASAVAAAAVLLGGFFLLRDTDSPPTSTGNPPATVAQADSSQGEEISIEEFEAELDELVYLSDLMEVADTSLLPDEDLAALLF